MYLRLAAMIELSWSAPPSCPTAEVVEQRVERILNRPLAAEPQTLTATAVVTPPRDGTHWTVTLESTSGQQRASRTLEAASCDELATATAVFLSILIEPEQVEPEPSPVPAPAPAPAPSRSVQTTATPSERPRFALGITASARSAGVPRWAMGGGVHGALSWHALRASLGLNGWLPVHQTLDGSETQGARLQLSSAHAKLCWQLRTTPLTGGLCAGGELSLLRGRGFGPSVEPQSAAAVFGSLVGGGVLELPLSEHLAVLAEAEALFPLGRRQVVFAGGAPAQIYEPYWGLRLACGAQWSF